MCQAGIDTLDRRATGQQIVADARIAPRADVVLQVDAPHPPGGMRQGFCDSVNTADKTLGHCSAAPAAATPPAAVPPGAGRFVDEREIHLGFIHVHAHDAHTQLVTETVAGAGTFAAQPQTAVLEMVIIVAQAGDMDQAVDIEIPERDKQAEVRDARDDAGHFLADAVAHINIQKHYKDFALGVVDLTNIVFFLSGTALFLVLAAVVQESRRWL